MQRTRTTWLALVLVAAALLGSCGDDAPSVGQLTEVSSIGNDTQSSEIVVASSVAGSDVSSTTTSLVVANSDEKIGYADLSTTTSTDPDGVLTPPSTALPVGSPDPAKDSIDGIPLRVTLTSAMVLESDIQPSVTVAKGAIIDFQFDNAFGQKNGLSTPFEMPVSGDPSIVRQVVQRHECPRNNTCATFEAVGTGKVQIDARGPSDPGVNPYLFVYDITVVDP